MTEEATAEILRSCLQVEKKMLDLDPDRLGCRDPGRYSFGAASQSGHMLHDPAWMHLLACENMLKVLNEILPDGFSFCGGGGDFVRGGTHNYQALHADLGPGRVPPEYRSDRNPPKIAVNFTVQAITAENGPMRVIPGKKVINGQQDIPPKFADEPEEYRQSKLFPLPAGAAILRDLRLWHGGTPNLSAETRFLPSVEVFSAKYGSFISGPHSSEGWCRACQWHHCSIPLNDRSCCLPESVFVKLPPEVQACSLAIRGPDAAIPTGFKEFAHLRRSWEADSSMHGETSSKVWQPWPPTRSFATSVSRPRKNKTSRDPSWNSAATNHDKSWKAWRGRVEWNRSWSEIRNDASSFDKHEPKRQAVNRSFNAEITGSYSKDDQPFATSVQGAIAVIAAVIAKSTRVTLGLLVLYRAVRIWSALLSVSERLIVGFARAVLRALPARTFGIIGLMVSLRRP